MKSLLLLSLFVSGIIHASETDSKFADQKKTVLEHISAQIATLENTRKCVESATDHDSIKKCHQAAKEERIKFEAERKKEKGQRIDDQIKKLEEKKKALGEKKI